MVYRNLESVQKSLKTVGVTASEVDESIQRILDQPCGILCLTRTSLRDGIRRASDPEHKEALKQRAFELVMEDLFGDIDLWYYFSSDEIYELEYFVIERLNHFLFDKTE